MPKLSDAQLQAKHEEKLKREAEREAESKLLHLFPELDLERAEAVLPDEANLSEDDYQAAIARLEKRGLAKREQRGALGVYVTLTDKGVKARAKAFPDD